MLNLYRCDLYITHFFCFCVIKLKLRLMTQLPFVCLVAVNGADYSMCSWVFSEASLHQQILRHQTLTVHRSLAHYTCRPIHRARQRAAYLTTSLMPAPHSRQNFSRLENTADLSSPLTARQRSWLSGCCFCCLCITAA